MHTVKTINKIRYLNFVLAISLTNTYLISVKSEHLTIYYFCCSNNKNISF